MPTPIAAILLLIASCASAPLFSQELARGNTSFGPGDFRQEEFLPVEEAFQLALEVVDEQQIRLYWQIADDYYLYRQRFKFALEDRAGPIELDPRLPAGVLHEDEYFGKSEVYYHALNIMLGAGRGSADAVLTVTSQGCADAGLCYPPQQQQFRVDFSSRSLAPIPRDGRFEQGTASGAGPVLLMMALAFLGGGILNLMPCVFPVLSLKMFSFASAGDAGQHRHGWVYAAGVVASFLLVAGVLIGLQQAGAAVGWGFQLQSPHFVAVLAYLFFIMGLALSGVVQLGAGFMGAGSSLAAQPGYSGSFFSGVLATLVASPCTAPFMGTALGFAVTQPAAIALLIFAALGAGMAAPMLALSYSSRLRRLLPAPGPWMQTFKQLLAFPLYATAIWLLWVAGRQTSTTAMALLLGGMLALALALLLWRYRTSVKLLAIACGIAAGAVLVNPMLSRPASSAAADPDGFSEQRLAALLQTGAPVFVNVGADWCITCLANEAGALNREAVLSAFEDRSVVYLKADWTNYDPEIANFLRRFNRNGVPLYLLYSGAAGQAPAILPQLLTTDILLRALEQL
ncbi:MAG: protein-disulfide reductase DsbD family protein [Halieaceae bacterium]|nr:protein-disulfide reductase DsbD family protein [Halieaceae bacterium]